MSTRLERSAYAGSSSRTASGAQNRARALAFVLFVLGVFVTALSLVIVAELNASIDRFNTLSTQVSGLAARERDLAQNLAKNALLMQSDYIYRRTYVDPHAELLLSANSFNDTLESFIRGGTAEVIGGRRVRVEPLTDPTEQQFVADATLIWKPIYGRIEATTSRSLLPGPEIEGIAHAVVGGGDGMAVLMNDLSLQLDRDSARRLKSLTQAQTALTASALIGFIIIVGSIFVRIRAARASSVRFTEQLHGIVDSLAVTTRGLAEAKTSTDMIMNTVSQGLFLLDRQFFIEPQYSQEAAAIFRTETLGGRNFVDLVRGLVSERTYATAKDFTDMLFDEERSERTLSRINPLEDVEVNFSNAETGGFTTRFLRMEFRRIYDDNDEIVQIFVAVSDTTERVLLERELREAEKQKERQFALLLGIVNIEPRALDDFLAATHANMRTVNESMRAEEIAGLVGSPSQRELHQRLDVVFRCVHNIKGGAALLHLGLIEGRASRVETKIAELRKKATLTGDDFLAIVLGQSELHSDLEELEDLRNKLAGIRARPPSVGRAPLIASNGTNGKHASVSLSRGDLSRIERSGDDTLERLAELAATIAARQGKQVAIEAEGFDLRGLTDAHRLAVKDVLVQLTRNAIVHGIESPEQRAREGKPKYGTVLIQRIGSDKESFGFLFHDDGRGVDAAQIRRRAVEAAFLTVAQAQALSDAEAVGVMFLAGFSTVSGVDADAGHGVGLDIVKSCIVDEFGGDIVVKSEAGRYTTFSVTIPLIVSASAREAPI